MPGAARLGDKAKADIDAHGCVGCPHTTTGPSIIGSANVNVNGMPAFRVNDVGVHTPCCGPNMWMAAMGASTVFVNGIPAMRKGDVTRHCGGIGRMIEGSQNVNIE